MSFLAPARQPHPTGPTETAAAAMSAPGRAERQWHQAAALVDEPGVVKLIPTFHWPRPARGLCLQCGPRVFWPCEPWLIATLARMRQASLPPRRTTRITWPFTPRRRKPVSWFGHDKEQELPGVR